ncbi:MAG TPA: methyltransferase domain-containing protein [Rhizomicrobium sp.]|nr:methyltransferase domain-containing protein [Rhizomicrobium sp.]
MAGNSHWNDYHRRWAQIKPPLRPDADVVAAFQCAIAGHADRVLLLGVTRELADIGAHVTAIDRNASMIANVWPGDTQSRKAYCGDWLSLPFEENQFTAAIGDGSLSAILYPSDYRTIFAQLSRVLRSEGICALRLFLTPDEIESVEAVKALAFAGKIASFHAFKWQFAMAMVQEVHEPNIAVADIRERFNTVFPDRAALSAASGWSAMDIETIDVYKNSPDVYSFPNMAQLRETIPETFRNVRLMQAGHYPLAERCPLLVMERL